MTQSRRETASTEREQAGVGRAAPAASNLTSVPEPGVKVRVSEHFSLGAQQDALDFVDVDIWGDDPLFVDPRALRTLHTPWTDECVTLLQDFFSTVLAAIRQGDLAKARYLLGHLREPNETHLGLSQGRPQGHGLGPGSARQVADALLSSEAIRSGLLEDLEETVLMIEGISFDKVSDMATNVIREPLIDFTAQQAALHGIPTRQVSPGPLWDPRRHEWFQRYADLPVAGTGRLLLIPKVIVRKKLHYRPDDYFRHYILEYLMEHEISSNSELVYLLQDGTPRVDKKDLIKKYGSGKHVAVEITKQHPEILSSYREDKRNNPDRALGHERLADELSGVELPDWDQLLEDVRSINPGREGADRYHRAIEVLLKALFHPDLALPQREVGIHGARKRIDITFANQAQTGFFAWLAQHHPAMYIIIECKNYSGDPANPELDQVAGRFSPSRGKIGFLVCRELEDKELFIKRCRDTADDQRGFVVPLDDEDLAELVVARRDGDRSALFDFLKQRFEQLVL